MKEQIRKIRFSSFISEVFKAVLITIISVFAIVGITKAGSLTPAAAPGSTMQNLTTIYNKNISAYVACYNVINCTSGAYTCYTGFSNLENPWVGQISQNACGSYNHVCCLPR